MKVKGNEELQVIEERMSGRTQREFASVGNRPVKPRGQETAEDREAVEESLPGINAPNELPPGEMVVARKMAAKGYAYAIQFSNPDGSDFGAPLYFKSPSEVGPFMRDNPTLRQKWLIQLNARDNNPFRESVNEAKRYNWNDQIITLPEIIAQAVSKDMAFMHGGRSKGKRPTYHINMAVSDDDVSTGFAVSFNQWYKAQLPDTTSDYTKKTFVAWSKGGDPNAAVIRPDVTGAEYQQALAKVKANRGKPVLPPDPLGGRRIRF